MCVGISVHPSIANPFSAFQLCSLAGPGLERIWLASPPQMVCFGLDVRLEASPSPQGQVYPIAATVFLFGGREGSGVWEKGPSCVPSPLQLVIG
jgi:hypothetical protein